VYFDNTVVSPDQAFEYDALYRLTHAEGREHTSLTQATDADITYGPRPHPDDPAALRVHGRPDPSASRNRPKSSEHGGSCSTEERFRTWFCAALWAIVQRTGERPAYRKDAR
jgi:hypothetical protein